MREGRVEDVVERMTKKGKMRQERLRVLRQTDSETGGFLVSEQQGGKGKRRDTDVMANHFSLEQSQELFVNAAAPRQRLVWGWHAAVAGYVGVTSAPGPGGLKTQGCLSGEEGQIQAWTHCGNRAALAIWGPSDGEAYLEMLPKSPLWARWKGRRNHPPPPPPTHPQHSLTPFLFFFLFFTQLLLCLLCPRFLSFALNEVAVLFLCQPQATTALHPQCQKSSLSAAVLFIFVANK